MKHICSALKRNGEKGFTLVELIVVIAILAILAAVAYPVYTGYIDYANKGVDRQTVGEVIHALELADYADSSLFGEGASLSVYLTNSGVQAIPKVQAALSDAMDLNSTRLQYDKWTNGDIMPQMAQIAGMADNLGLKNLWESVKDANGNIPVAQYAASADEMWEEVLSVAAEIAGRANLGKTPGEYLNLAAQYTTTTGVNSGANMGTAWEQASVPQAFKGASSGAVEYEVNAAGVAASMARNNAFAEFLAANGYNVSQDTLDYLHSTDNKLDLVNGYTGTVPTGAESFIAADWDKLVQAATDYRTKKVYTGNGQGYTQAYVDGMVYYGLMQSVVNMSGTGEGQYDPQSDDYLSKIGDIVSMTGNILSGTTSLDDINAELTLFEAMKDVKGSAVRVSATKTGGVLNIVVWPKDADPRTESGGSQTINYTTSANPTKEEFKEGYTVTLELSSKDATNKTGTITVPTSGSTYSYDGSVVSVSVASGTGIVTVTALKPGEADITMNFAGRGQGPFTWHIHVIVH